MTSDLALFETLILCRRFILLLQKQRFKELDSISSLEDVKEKILKSIIRNFQYNQDEDRIRIYSIVFDVSHIPNIK